MTLVCEARAFDNPEIALEEHAQLRDRLIQRDGPIDLTIYVTATMPEFDGLVILLGKEQDVAEATASLGGRPFQLEDDEVKAMFNRRVRQGDENIHHLETFPDGAIMHEDGRVEPL